MIHLSLYCRNTSFLSMRVIRCMMHISHQEYRDILELDCIHSFWSQHTEKRNTTISQMRLRSVFKIRTSILNTATTEHLGYGSISFFVCFPLMNQIVIHPSIYRFPPQYSLRQIVFHRYLHNPSMPGKHIFHHTK